MTRIPLRTFAVPVSLFAFWMVASSCGDEPTDITDFLTITGAVYEGFDEDGNHIDPVAGAIVSTSIDNERVETEDDGRFVLETTVDASDWACQEYEVSVVATDLPEWSLSGKWPRSPIALVITLKPPTPTTVPIGLPCEL